MANRKSTKAQRSAAAKKGHKKISRAKSRAGIRKAAKARHKK